MPHVSFIHTLIDFSKDEGCLVFYGTDVPLDRLFQLYDGTNVVKSVDEFLHQYPQVQRIAAYAVLALAGRYGAFALDSFLFYAPDHLSDQAWGRHVSLTMDAFKVDWENLVFLHMMRMRFSSLFSLSIYFLPICFLPMW